MLVMHTDIKLSYDENAEIKNELLITDAEGRTVALNAPNHGYEIYGVHVPGFTQGLVWLGCGFMHPDSTEDQAKMKGRRSLRLMDGIFDFISVSANRGTVNWPLLSPHQTNVSGHSFNCPIVSLNIQQWNGQPFVEGTLRFYYTTETELRKSRETREFFDILRMIETTHSNRTIE